MINIEINIRYRSAVYGFWIRPVSRLRGTSLWCYFLWQKNRLPFWLLSCYYVIWQLQSRWLEFYHTCRFVILILWFTYCSALMENLGNVVWFIQYIHKADNGGYNTPHVHTFILLYYKQAWYIHINHNTISGRNLGRPQPNHWTGIIIRNKCKQMSYTLCSHTPHREKI